MACWFSARVRALVLVEHRGTIDAHDSIFMIRMPDEDLEAAKGRVLDVARAKLEQDYVNMDGERTQWRVSRVLTLDVLRAADLDGVEVWQEGVAPSIHEQHRFGAVLDPMAAPTENSGV